MSDASWGNLGAKVKRNTRINTVPAIIGDETGAIYHPYLPGYVWVRQWYNNGYGKAFPVLGPAGNSIVLTPGTRVNLAQTSDNKLKIEALDVIGGSIDGTNLYQSNTPQLSSGMFIGQQSFITALVIPQQVPDLTVTIKSWLVVVNGTYYEFPGIQSFDISASVPSSGNNRFAVIFLDNDYLTPRVTASTARANTDLPLGAPDIQECITAAPVSSTPLAAIRLYGGQTQIVNADIVHDMRQIVNTTTAQSDLPQNPGLAKMGPVNGPVPGSAATPTYRSIQVYDLPDRYFAAYNYQVADGIYRIGLAKSSDGRSFRRVTQPIVDIGAGGSWEASGVFQPALIDVNGVFYCYYIGYDGTYKKIGLSRSFDGGATWTKYGSNPVLSANGSGWETTGSAQHLQTPFVMYDPDDSDSAQRFKLWYAGGLYGSGGIGYAYSSDGLSWTKYASNPVLTPGTAGAFDDTYMSANPVVKVGTTYYLFYGGDHPVTGVDHWKVGLATFTNPKSSYTKSGSNPILAGDALSTTITTSVSIGNTSIAVTSSAGFAVGMPVWLSDATNHYLSTITSIPDSTHIVCADTAPVALSSSPVIRSANYNSITFNSAYYDGGWRFYGTAFQPGFDNSHSYEIGFAAYAYGDLTNVRYDYESGMILPTLTSESTGTGVSHENPAVLDLAPWYRRFLGNTALGSGNVSGPGSSTDRAIATWDGTGGTLLRDNANATVDSSGNLKANEYKLPSATASTLATDAFTVSSGFHALTSETGTTDNLATINGGSGVQDLTIQAASSHTITVKNGTGNIFLNGGADFALSGDKTLRLFYDGTNWSDIGAGGGGTGGGGGTISTTTKTVQTRTVLYDNTLGSAGNWDVSSIDQTYDDLEIVLVIRGSTSAAETGVKVHFNNDSTTANYLSGWAYGTDGSAVAGRYTDSNDDGGSYAVADTGTANRFATYRGYIENYTDTGKHKNLRGEVFVPISDSHGYSFIINQLWKSTSAINRISIAASTGTNFVTGSRFMIIGIKQEAVVTNVTGSASVAFTQNANATVANTVAETTLIGTVTGSKTLGAGALSSVGRQVRIQAWGFVSDTATPTVRLKFKLGSTVVLDSGAITLGSGISNKLWRFDGTFTVQTAGASGQLYAQGQFYENAVFNDIVNTAQTGIDLTVSQVIDLTATWSAASASNTITCTNMIVEYLN